LWPSTWRTPLLPRQTTHFLSPPNLNLITWHLEWEALFLLMSSRRIPSQPWSCLNSPTRSHLTLSLQLLQVANSLPSFPFLTRSLPHFLPVIPNTWLPFRPLFRPLSLPCLPFPLTLSSQPILPVLPLPWFQYFPVSLQPTLPKLPHPRLLDILHGMIST
jgi:hypothetical protein